MQFQQANAPSHVKVIQGNDARLCVGEVIESYMPSVAQLLHNPYSWRVIGRDVRAPAATAAILMWSMSSFSATSDFRPNHFALLQTRPTDVITVHNEYTDVTTKEDNSTAQDDQAARDSTDNLVDIQHAGDNDVSDDVSNAAEHVNVDISNTSVASERPDHAQGMQPLPDDDWLTTKELVQILRFPLPSITHSRVPPGRKDNSYCILDMSTNVKRLQRGRTASGVR